MIDLTGKTYKDLNAMFPGGFVVTGKTTNGTRFSDKYSDSFYAFSINLYTGRVWGIDKDGKRKLLKTSIN